MKIVEILEAMIETKIRYNRLIQERADNIKFVENKKKAISELDEKIAIVDRWNENRPRPDQFFSALEKEIIVGYGIPKTEFATIQGVI